MPQNLLPFEDFLNHLQQQGFTLGVDDFLQIQTLLNRLPKDCPPEKLKSLMCPLLVSNEAEQMLFYKAFDCYFADLKLQYAELEENVPPTIAPLQKADEELEKYHKYGEELEWSLKGFFYQKFQTIVVSVIVLFLLFGGGFFYFNALQEESIKERNVEKIIEEDSSKNIDSSTSSKPTKNTVDKPSNSPITSKEKNTSSPSKKDNFQKSKKETIGFIIFVYGLLLLLIFAAWIFVLHFKVRREFYLEALENIEPPQYWNIQVPKSKLNLARSQAFKHAANRLQKRRLIPTQKVNIAETVQATIAAAGFPDFQYLQTSALPEYLLLIDQSSTKDQQTKWFEMWFEALKEREVIVHRFFYHGNPEWCWDEEQHYVSLAELYHRFGDCRLVVIADGSQHHTALEHPPNPLQRGNLYQNSPFEGGGGDVSVFADWQEKVLLSTQPLPKSVAQYLEEESGFVVLPARMESLNQLSDIFEAENPKAAKSSIYPTTAIASDLEKLNVSEQVVELKRKLTDVGFRCLCAAAMYPEMNWDLTVFLAETLYDERELLKEENMLPLVSLPYFRKGFMAEDLRRALTKELDADSKRLVKGAILHLLQLHPLVEDEYSAEFFDYQLHIALQDAQLHPQDQHKLATLKHLMEQRQFKESRYKQVVLRYMERRENTSGDKGLGLGEAFKKKFNREDIEVKEITTSRKSEKVTYVYPKVPLMRRAEPFIVDLVFTSFFIFVITFFACILYFVFSIEIENSTLLIGGGIILSLIYLSIDGLGKGSGFGKHGVFRVIDIYTNLPCSLWQSFVRRSFPFLLMLLVAIIDRYLWIEAALILCVVVSFQYLLSFVSNSQGRKMMDYLAGTQVVREVDYQQGNFEIEKIVVSNDIAFPIADTGNRIEAASMEGTLALFCTLMTSIVLCIFGNDVDLSKTLGFLAGSFFWVMLEIFNDRTLGKSSTHLIIVGIKTNEKARLWKRLARKIVDLLLLLALYFILYYLNLDIIPYLFVFAAYLVVNFVFIYVHRGSRLGDYLFGTQVINVSDFEAENYEVVEPKEVVEMPINN